MNTTWSGSVKIIEALDRKIAQLKREIEILNKALRDAHESSARSWRQQHERTVTALESEDGDWLIVPEWSEVGVYASEAEARAAAERVAAIDCQRCSVVGLATVCEVPAAPMDEEEEETTQEEWQEQWKYGRAL